MAAETTIHNVAKVRILNRIMSCSGNEAGYLVQDYVFLDLEGKELHNVVVYTPNGQHEMPVSYGSK